MFQPGKSMGLTLTDQQRDLINNAIVGKPLQVQANEPAQAPALSEVEVLKAKIQKLESERMSTPQASGDMSKYTIDYGAAPSVTTEQSTPAVAPQVPADVNTVPAATNAEGSMFDGLNDLFGTPDTIEQTAADRINTGSVQEQPAQMQGQPAQAQSQALPNEAKQAIDTMNSFNTDIVKAAQLRGIDPDIAMNKLAEMMTPEFLLDLLVAQQQPVQQQVPQQQEQVIPQQKQPEPMFNLSELKGSTGQINAADPYGNENTGGLKNYGF